MRFSFTTGISYTLSIASDNNGYTILRFDDTNPEKECHEYIVNIEENVKWLGYTVKFINNI
jgi:glutaminyl-tRNA synthetase